MLVDESLDVEIALIDVDPAKNPRRGRGFEEESIEELAARLYSEGQLTPITLRRKEGGRFELVAGERHLRAARVIGWKTLRAELLAPGVTAEQAAVLSHIENLDRVDLSDYDRAAAARELADAQKISLRAYAERCGVTYETLKRQVAWLRTLPPAVLDGWRGGDPRAAPRELERLSRMVPEEAERAWHELAAPKVPELGEPGGGKRPAKKPKRPGPRQLEALMEKLDKSELPDVVKEWAMQLIEYVQGGRKSPPSFNIKLSVKKGK